MKNSSRNTTQKNLEKSSGTASAHIGNLSGHNTDK